MLNHIVLQGRLCADPELRHTPSGVAVASVSVACDRDRKQEDGSRETDFIDLVAWRGTAEFLSRYFRKGDMVLAEGRMQIRNWTDKEGNKRRSAEVQAAQLYFGSAKTGNRSGETAVAPQEIRELDEDDGNLPF